MRAEVAAAEAALDRRLGPAHLGFEPREGKVGLVEALARDMVLLDKRALPLGGAPRQFGLCGKGIAAGHLRRSLSIEGAGVEAGKDRPLRHLVAFVGQNLRQGAARFEPDIDPQTGFDPAAIARLDGIGGLN